MRVGIIGAGFVGLTAAYRLAKQGVRVEVYESSDSVGGLASGFSIPQSNWSLERFYHHIFFNDHAIIQLAREVDWPPLFFRPTTSVYFDGLIYPFDSAFHLLRFPHLSLYTKLRMGAVLGFLKLSPFWKPLERITASDFLVKTMGVSGYEAIWKPLLTGKFGPKAREVNAAWFWARVQKRTARLGYFEQGFQGLANRLQDSVLAAGGEFHFHSPVKAIRKKGKKIFVGTQKGTHLFDQLLVTVNSPLFLSMTQGLPERYKQRLAGLSYLDSLVVVLVMRRSVFDDVYWLNVLDSNFPFLVVVEHTNMIDPENYGGNHIVYLGTYIPDDHQCLRLSKKAVVRLAVKQLEKIAANFNKSDIIESYVHYGHHTQPIIPLNYSSLCSSMETPINNLFLTNMSMIYPWDRGTNYAVWLGERAAALILKKIE